MISRENEVEIVIMEDGTIKADQIGWEGSSCHGAIDDLLKKIGKKIEVKKKQDFYREQKVKIRHRNI